MPSKKLKTVLKGVEWRDYYSSFDLDQAQCYRCSHKFQSIFKVGEYYFCCAIARGYRNLAALKRVITIYL